MLNAYVLTCTSWRLLRCCSYLITSLILILTVVYSIRPPEGNSVLEDENSNPGPLDEIIYVKPKPRKLSRLYFQSVPTQNYLADNVFGSTPRALVSSIAPKLHLYMVPYGGLGNQMFQAAACISIALWNKREPVLSPEFEQLYQMFDLPITRQQTALEMTMIKEEKYATFSPRIFSLPVAADVAIYGYFQSYKYFTYFREAIMKNFKLKKTLIRHALQEKLKACNAICSRVNEMKLNVSGSNPFIERALPSCKCTSVVSIGVHIRRNAISPNYNYVDNNYLNNAMNYFRQMFKNIHFMVVSDDVPWCTKHLTDGDVYIVPEMAPDHHFAVLAKCDHHVLSVGTFGWWAAWLAGGTTVYFDNPVPKTFEKSHEFNKKDFFPGHWISLH